MKNRDNSALFRRFIFFTSRIMETGHRSILVMDRDGHVQSILAITDIMVLGQSFQRCLHML